MTNPCVVDANRQVLRCDHCGLEIALPMPLGSGAFGVACRAFWTVHDECSPGGANACPEDMPRTLVGTMALYASILFEEGDAFQDGGELAEFVLAVAEIARKEAP